MELLIPSIPHTGTNFTLKLFRAAGFEDRTTNDRRSDGCVYHCHTHKDALVESILRLADQMPMVIPLRHPFVVEESWKRREKPIKELVKNFLIVDRLREYNPYFLPVDSDHRSLEEINEGLNLELQTDWGIENSYFNTGELRYTDLTPSQEIADLVNELGWLNEHYPKPGE